MQTCYEVLTDSHSSTADVKLLKKRFPTKEGTLSKVKTFGNWFAFVAGILTSRLHSICFRKLGHHRYEITNSSQD